MKMLFAALLACATCVAGDVTVEGVTFTPTEEAAVLAVVQGATFEVLHYQYDVYSSNSQNIIAARPIKDLQALAAVDGVSYFVLNLLKTKATQQCGVVGAQGGTYSGVTFTDAEATRALAAANLQSYKALVKVADLYTHKAQDLLRSRPVCTMSQLRSVPGFGYTPLNLVKTLSADPRTCFSNEDCTAPSKCRGKPFDGILSSGKCETPVVVEGASCDNDKNKCPADLVCVGLVFNDGRCQAAWFGGVFTPPAQVSSVSVPAVGVKASTFFAVSGLATVPVDVILRLDASDVGQPAGLKIVVTDPNGVSATYYDGSATPTEPVPTSKRVPNSLDDTVNGEWKVTITNSGVSSGSIKSFVLDLTSRWD